MVREVDALVASGYREIVLSGINLGRWGRELPTRTNFAAMLRAILDRTSIEKLRISSVEPMDWTNELIELVASSPRICKHAHVPLQSGSDKILRKMHRKYRPWHYADRIERIRAAMPDAAIGADVMVGFPGETDDDFEQTRAFIERLPFTYLHVFTYSSRPGTPSAAMPDQVPVQVARERNRILRELAAQKEALVHGVVHRAGSGGHHAHALRRRVHRGTDGQLSQVKAQRQARTQPVGNLYNAAPTQFRGGSRGLCLTARSLMSFETDTPISDVSTSFGTREPIGCISAGDSAHNSL